MTIVCVILVASIDTPLEKDLLHNKELRGLPRALLPVAGKPIIDYWWDVVSSCKEINDTFLVTNAKHYKYYERWATARGLPVGNIINNGCTSARTLPGASYDLLCALKRSTKLNSAKPSTVVSIAGDSLFYKEFDLNQTLQCYLETQENGSSLALCYNLGKNEDPTKRGIVEVDPKTKRVLKFVERPKPEQVNSNSMACPLFYILNEKATDHLTDFLLEVSRTDNEGIVSRNQRRNCGRFIEYLVRQNLCDFYCMRLGSGFSLVGVNSGLSEYIELDRVFRSSSLQIKGTEIDEQKNGEIHTCVNARIGIMGNPSDGFNGKTLSSTIKNFHADVYISESEKLRLLPHPLFDPNEFGSLGDLREITRREGYNGGMRLMLGTCKKFFDYCVQHKIALPKRNFTASYDTNIPRQVGLSGSSAIITAFVKALMEFYGLTERDIPKPLLANFILSVETEEMGINAGLQDRVVQVYGGLVYMDFSKEIMEDQGYGYYEKLGDHSIMPKNQFFLAYSNEPSDSGKIHSDVKERYNQGDEEVVEAMKQFASKVDVAKKAIINQDYKTLGELMNANFDRRRKLYGDAVIGKENLEMVEIARSVGAYCKFPGSGGCIVGLALDPNNLDDIREKFQSKGYVFVPLEF